ncbi:DUF2783 domain-containing protein [Sandarakinorhabdus cyanobacteriorum]|uniref:DUF2783 domain-containing protein n=1 Tax=Sandarakinorhabdus cyanobacteriorum TaxID=1981098 RepID=A0A255YK27_9SPHN|nr:DUF2783 domain-containing protein [Sandarakinorhabdus cyanobacteriorum]OYQ29548.1 DUF2783 domain-containing protein [Sandarakinorhabdus cyanobacteriorum]
MPLVTEPNLPDPDAVFTMLTAMHDGLDGEASAALNARLLLILANHIGDAEVLRQAIALALRQGR